MPIPKPNPGETEAKFISRCMGNDTMVREYPDQKQRAGVCYTQFRKAKESVKGNGKYASIAAPGIPEQGFMGIVERITRRTDTRGMKIIIGYRPDGSSELLEYLYNQDLFTPERARSWIAQRHTKAPPEWLKDKQTEGKELMMKGILRERTHPTALPGDIKIDKENKMIRGIALINSRAQNGRRWYGADILRGAVSMFEGAKSYIDHPKDGEETEIRSIGELLGRVVNVRAENTGENAARLRADLQVFPKVGEWIFETAEQFPDMVGMSINAFGKLKRKDGKEIVESIDGVHSVDLVTDMGATVSMFESQENESPENEDEQIMEKIKELEAQLAALNEKITNLEKENGDLKEEKAKLIQERDAKEKEILITTILDEQDIPKGARTDAVMDAIRALEGKEKIQAFAESLKKISKSDEEIPNQEEGGGGMKESADKKVDAKTAARIFKG